MSASINVVTLTLIDPLHQQHNLFLVVPLTNGSIKPSQTATSQKQSALSQFRSWSPSVPIRDTDEVVNVSEETGAAILDTVTRFSSAVFRGQADACGMATSDANYIAWLRNAPQSGTLETRLRELCDVSQSNNKSALEELVTALEEIAPPGRTTAMRLATLEEDLSKEVQERAEFFRTRYTPCALLKEQQARDGL
ncbi:hypothetical protein LI328DRAFT_162876 [Trichoderma asperelloides]|nr:hypothetical protein LI328DRAFT_162876 [Trichoderma asperelloides]